MKELDFASAAPEADEVDEDEEDGTESDSEGSFEDEEVDTGLASAQHVTEQRTETTKKVSVEAKPKADDKIELDSNGTSGRPFTLVSGDVEPSSASVSPHLRGLHWTDSHSAYRLPHLGPLLSRPYPPSSKNPRQLRLTVSSRSRLGVSISWRPCLSLLALRPRPTPRSSPKSCRMVPTKTSWRP